MQTQELVLVFGGMDAAQGDPTGQCAFTPRIYGWMTEQLRTLADGNWATGMRTRRNNVYV